MKLRSSLAVVLGLLVCVLAGGSPSSAQAAGGCAAKAVRSLTFVRTGPDTGQLTWKRPRSGLPKGGRYRVVRAGRVIGDTRRRSMPVKFSPGRPVAFTVRVVGRSGRPTRCRVSTRADIGLNPPAAPTDLLVASVTPTQISLTWNPATPGDAPIAGYQLVRDGQDALRVAATSGVVPISSFRRYSFQVAAVDTRGNRSPLSAPVQIATDHIGPTAPGRPAVTVLGENDLTLSWTPSVASAGRIVGYRVMRNSTVVVQVRDPQAAIANLALASEYTFTIVAVDSFGFLSAPSPPFTVSTNPPPPSQGHAHAFLLASTDRAYEDFLARYLQIGTVYPTYFECDRQTLRFLGSDDARITRAARLRQVKVMPRFNCQSPTALHRMLTDPAIRSAAMDQLIGLLQAYQYDGLNLDLEAGVATDRAAYTSFVAELAGRLHAIGKELSIDVSPKFADNLTHPRSGIFDYPALANAVDTVFVMSWGIHWTTSAPGAISDLQWFTRVADYVATMPNKERFVMGAPLYGTDWPAAGGQANPGVPGEYVDLMARAAQFGVTPTFDPVSAEMTFTYTDLAGVPHTVWCTTGQGISMRLQVARARRIGGFGFWRLGNEDPSVWADPALAAGAVW
jgi:spore germination protein YaaH